MRLTLRSLLGYMHGLLPAEDAEQMAKRIEESEVAKSLMHRIKDVSRRLRLGAPDVRDTKGGLDPNTVAEYLDHVLPPEQVADFEKVCLESDMHLAEVAACHEILAMVLRQAAEIDPASRQKMYELGSTTAGPENPAGSPAEPVASAASGASAESKSESPADDRPKAGPATRARPSRWSTLALAAILLAVGGIGLLTVTGQINLRKALSRWFGSASATPVAQAPQQPIPAPAGKAAVPQAPETERTGATSQGTATPTTPAEPSTENAGTGGSHPSTGAEGSSSNADQADTSPAKSEGGELVQPRDAVQSPDHRPPGAAEEDAEPSPQEQTPAENGEPQETETAMADVRPETDVAGGQPEPTPHAPLPREPIGQLISPGEILLWFDSGASAWRRLPETEPVRSKTTYLSLPAFRPVIQLNNHIEVRLVGAAKVQLLPKDERGIAGLGLEFGSLVIRLSEAPSGNTEEQKDQATPPKLHLRVADQAGMLYFEDLPCVVGVEASRSIPPGADPETAPGTAGLYLYVAAGKVLWGTSDRAEVAVAAPMRVALMRRPMEAEVMSNLPDWMAADTIPLLDLQAKSVLDRALVANRPVILSLRELAEHRRREVNWLALRALETMDDFEPLVAALDDPAHRAMWPDYIDQLRAAVRRSALSAAQVRAAMEKLFGPDGTYLYEMLWKYHRGNFDRQTAATLVKFLEHKRLALRVVAFANLRRLSSLGFYYRPEDPPIERQGPVRKWKEWVRTNPAFQEKPAASPSTPQAAQEGGLSPLGTPGWLFEPG